jgi:hypothetical protein
MPFDVRKPYRALNGAELKEVIVARLKTAMDLDATVNLTRSFPLVRYRVTVELTPFIRTGIGAADVKPEHQSVYEVEGEAFLPVQEEAIELVEESPIYGVDGDPQQLRKLAGMGTVETRKTDTGETVDVRIRDRGPQPELARVSSRPMVQPEATQPAREFESGTLAAPSMDERLDWAPADPNNPGGKLQQQPGYKVAEKAISKAVQEGEIPPNAAGRVSIVGSGGVQDHGKRGPVQFGRRER